MDPISVILLVVGFGLVIFVHELGHFLAAKYVGIRVDQFALGFGQALLSWRKGLGLTLGSSEPRLAKLKKDNPNFDEKAYGETEYRLNWMPLGGYVKMMGQDDTKPGLQVDNPRSYTAKSVGARMLVISAGVIMNIIFAIVGFMILFLTGLQVPAPEVGLVVPMSPAQFATTVDGKPAPLQVGDRILTIDGAVQYDFSKIRLATALAKRGRPLTVEVKRRTGAVETVLVTPRSVEGSSMGLMSIGIAPNSLLEIPELKTKAQKKEYAELSPDENQLAPGETITQVNGVDVKPNEYWKLDQAIQQAQGQRVNLTVRSATGQTRQLAAESDLITPFGDEEITIAGMQPRLRIKALLPQTAVKGKIEPGDVILSIRSGGDLKNDPPLRDFLDRVFKAGDAGSTIDLKILRQDKEISLPGITPNIKIPVIRKKGLGVVPGLDYEHPVLAGTLKDSPTSGIPAGSTILAINDVHVKNWFDVMRELKGAQAGKPLAFLLQAPAGGPQQTMQITLNASDLTKLQAMRFSCSLSLAVHSESRITSNILQAAWWGITETRDFILQFYVTLQRMSEGSVGTKNLMGPLGIVQAGVQVADRGVDYLLWFLAMISANLAVVNFLPIPVVDGGHFMFLIIEKIQGKPVAERTQVIAQYIGLSLIGLVFILATYQDIMRIFGGS